LKFEQDFSQSLMGLIGIRGQIFEFFRTAFVQLFGSISEGAKSDSLVDLGGKHEVVNSGLSLS
jgi:hypothetical protein